MPRSDMRNRFALWTALTCAMWVACAASCVVTTTPLSDLALDVDGESFRVSPEGEAVTFLASASGGEPPYSFRWSVERSPDALFDDDSQLDQAEVTTVPVAVQGEYALRVRVTDSAGTSRTGFVTLKVGPGLPQACLP